jgi:hypothetical protein
VAEDTRIGTELAGYRIESRLGRGGMGVVYLAEHLRLGRKVALKILAPELAENERFRERFIRESRLAAAIDHPNIVPIYDADERDGVLFIAMRYVEGTDLRRILQGEGALDPPRMVAIVGQVADALDAAHRRGLVHRDVKPANVLVDRDEHAFLSDFGLTKRALSVSGLTTTGQLVGTIDYVAPEHIRGAAVDGRADVYSLGCLVYECLTGSVPFSRDMEVAVLWAHVEEPPPSPSTVNPAIPPEVDAVVERALAKQPDDRHPTAGALAAELRSSFHIGEPAVASAVGRPRRNDRRRWVPAAFLGLALAGAAVLAWFLVEGEGVRVPDVDTVARISDGSFDAVVEVGDQPTALATGLGRVWVGDLGSEDLFWVDPGSLEAQHSGASGRPTGLAVGHDVVWIVHGFGAAGDRSDVAVFDPRTEQITHAFDAPSAARAVAFGANYLWLGDPIAGEVQRYDPVTQGSPESFPLVEDELDRPAPGFITVGGDPERVWIVDELQPRVFVVDPDTGGTESIGVSGGNATAIAIGPDAVWVTSVESDSVTVLEPTGDPREDRAFGAACDGPTGIVVAGDGVWIACSLSGWVIRIDPTSLEITATLEVNGSPDAMTMDDAGDVWVAVHDF